MAGSGILGSQLSGTYNFVDPEDAERAPRSSGTARAMRRHQRGRHRRPRRRTTPYVADEGKFLIFEVTARSATGWPNVGTARRATTALPSNPAARHRRRSTSRSRVREKVDPCSTARTSSRTINERCGAGHHVPVVPRDVLGTDAVAIEGATAQAHAVTVDDEGKFLIFQVTPRAATAPVDGVPVRVATSAPIAPLEGSAPYIENGKIVGKVTVGGELTIESVFRDADNDKEGATTYQWAYGSPGFETLIDGATAKTYTVTNREFMDQVQVRVTPRSATGTPKIGSQTPWFRSSAFVGANPPIASGLEITGILTMGETLHATYTVSDDDGDDVSSTTVQWFRANNATGAGKVAIPGQTGADYTIQVADEGKFLIFEVTPRSSSPIANTGTVASVATAGAVIALAGSAPTATDLGITGTAKVGNTLRGEYRHQDVDAGEVEGLSTYQWYRADDASETNLVAIPNATGREYVPTAVDQGAFLYFGVVPVSVSGSPKVGIEYRVHTSVAVEAAVGTKPTATGVRIDGTPQVGLELQGIYAFNDPRMQSRARRSSGIARAPAGGPTRWPSPVPRPRITRRYSRTTANS